MWAFLEGFGSWLKKKARVFRRRVDTSVYDKGTIDGVGRYTLGGSATYSEGV